MALALAGIALAGCGGSGGNGPANRATCGRTALTLVGELDGRPFDVKVGTNWTSLVFQQDSQPYTLDVSYNGGTFHMEWSTAVQVNGPPSAATGTLVMPYEGPPVMYPICAADGTISESDLDQDPFTTNYPFTLRMLEFCPNFTGAKLPGSIDGCIGN